MIAFGELGMTSSEFWNSSPKEFYYRQKGYYQKIHQREKNEWERARWMVFRMKTGIADKKEIGLTDICVFPWEEEKIEAQNAPPDPEYIKRMAAAMDRHAKQESNPTTK